MGNPSEDRGVRGEPRRALSTPHLLPALVAVVLVAAVLLAGGVYGRSVVAGSLDGLAAHLNDADDALFAQKNQGGALQRAAFARADYLPAFGSSELLDSGETYHARRLLREHEVGFDLFPIAREGAPILSMLQKLATLGPDVRGKKVVVSISPGLFLDATSPANYYAGSFSPLHAGELAFSSDVGRGVKQAAARRMLAYPATLDGDPLLRLALESLAADSPLAGPLYAALQPIGRARNAALRLQDEWRTLALIGDAEAARAPRERDGAAPDWPSLLAQAEREYRPQSDNNPFGFWNPYWERKRDEIQALAGSSSDVEFARRLDASQTWGDFELLLRALREVGAEPLVLSSPLHGPYYDHLGVSREARSAYYARLRALTAAHGARLVDFAEHEDDRAFATDQWGHLSPKGWVSYAIVLDQFHRGALR